MLETDFERLLERIEAAGNSIANRSRFGKELTVEECLELETSLCQLRTLRRERTELHKLPAAKRKRTELGQNATEQPAP